MSFIITQHSPSFYQDRNKSFRDLPSEFCRQIDGSLSRSIIMTDNFGGKNDDTSKNGEIFGNFKAKAPIFPKINLKDDMRLDTSANSIGSLTHRRAHSFISSSNSTQYPSDSEKERKSSYSPLFSKPSHDGSQFPESTFRQKQIIEQVPPTDKFTSERQSKFNFNKLLLKTSQNSEDESTISKGSISESHTGDNSDGLGFDKEINKFNLRTLKKTDEDMNLIKKLGNGSKVKIKQNLNKQFFDKYNKKTENFSESDLSGAVTGRSIHDEHLSGKVLQIAALEEKLDALLKKNELLGERNNEQKQFKNESTPLKNLPSQFKEISELEKKVIGLSFEQKNLIEEKKSLHKEIEIIKEELPKFTSAKSVKNMDLSPGYMNGPMKGSSPLTKVFPPSPFKPTPFDSPSESQPSELFLIIDNLTNQNNTLGKILNDKLKELEEAKRKIDNLESHAPSQKVIEELARERDSWKNSFTLIDRDLKTLQVLFCNNENERNVLRRANAELLGNVSHLNKEKELLLADANKKNELLNEITRKAESNLANVLQVTSQRDQLVRERVLLIEEIRKMQTNTLMAERGREELERLIRFIERESFDKIEDKGREIESLKSKFKDLEEFDKKIKIQQLANDQLLKENEILKNKLAFVEEQALERINEFECKIIKEKDEVFTQRNDLQLEVEQLHLEITHLQALIHEGNREREALEFTNRKKNEKAKKIKAEVETLRALFEEKERMVKLSEERIILYAVEIERLHEVINQQYQEAETWREKYSVIENYHKLKFEEMHSTIESQSEVRLLQERQKIMAHVEFLNKTISDLKQELKSRTEVKGKFTSDFNLKREDYQYSFEELNQSLIREREEKENLKAMMLQGNKERDFLRRAISEFECKMSLFQELENKLRFLKAENEKLNGIIIERCRNYLN